MVKLLHMLKIKVTGCRLTQENFTVVRHKDCKIIWAKDLCTPCGNYQSNMRVNTHRLKLKEHRSTMIDVFLTPHQ